MTAAERKRRSRAKGTSDVSATVYELRGPALGLMRGEAFGPPCSRSWSRFEKLTIEA